jgi:hypothetical protein
MNRQIWRRQEQVQERVQPVRPPLKHIIEGEIIMAYDAKSRKLEIGDRVLIPGIITGLAFTDEGPNCAVDLEYRTHPDKKITILLNLNTQQVIKADEQPEAVPMAPRPGPSARA